MLGSVLKIIVLITLKIIGEIGYFIIKAVCYPFVLMYLPVMKFMVRTYIRALIRMKKIHAFVFKYVISMYYSKGPSSMLIKDILDEEIARSQRGY
jgi:hypothetical protein